MTYSNLWRRGLALVLVLLTMSSLVLEGAALSVSPAEQEPLVEQTEEPEPSLEEDTDSPADPPEENWPEPSEPEVPQMPEEELPQAEPEVPEEETPETEPEEPVQETPETDPEEPVQETPETDPEPPAEETPDTQPELPEDPEAPTVPEEPEEPEKPEKLAEPVYQLRVDNTQSLTLEYDDRYSFSDFAEGAVILKMETEQVTSYQVSKGSKTARRDTDVLVADGNSDTDVVAAGVGRATVLLVAEDQLEEGLAALNGQEKAVTYAAQGEAAAAGTEADVPSQEQMDGANALWESETESVPMDAAQPVLVDVIEVHVTVKPAKLTMMFLAGQSNMEGVCGNNASGQMVNSVLCPEGEVYSTYAPSSSVAGWRIAGIPENQFSTDAKTLVAGSLTGTANQRGGVLAYPVDALTSALRGKAGMDGALAYEWNRLTGDKVWVINAARSGITVSKWEQGGLCYNRALGVYKAAIQTMEAEVNAGHYTRGNRLLFWMQGEADINMSSQQYLTYFQSMQSGLTSACQIEYLGLIPPRSSQGDYTNAEDIAMTGPRVAQYYMANSTNSQFKRVYVVSNVHEQWISNTAVQSYFRTAYPGGKLTYSLRKSSNLSGLPATVGQVHSDIHFRQVAHNENGLTAARNMYYIVKNRRPSSNVNVSWRNAKGKDLGNSVTLQTNDSTHIIPVVTPVYNSKKVSIKSSTAYMTYNQKAGLLQTTRAGTASLQARDGSGKLLEALTVRVEVCPTPALGSISNQAGGVQITWSRSSRASGYYVYRKQPGQGWSKIATVTSNSYTDPTASSGETYIYTVRAYQGRTLSDYDATGLRITYVVPTRVKVSGVAGTVQVTWTKVNTADSYKVYRRVKNGGWKALAVMGPNTLSYTDTTAGNGTLYEYAVVSRCNGSQSAYAPVTWLGLDTPQPVSAQNVENGIRVSWKRVNQATGYLVYRRIPGTKWARIAKLTSGSTCYYVDETGRNGTNYEYTMKATYGSIASDYDRKGCGTLCLHTPGITALQNKVNGIALRWNPVAGATAYQVYRKNSGGSWVRLKNVTGTSYTDTSSLTSGTTYTYTIRACQGSVLSGYKSGGTSLLYLDTPGIRTLANTAGGVQITWNKVAGATSYLVYRKNGGSSWLRLGTVSGTSYTDTTAPSGTACTYTVRAARGSDWSDYNHTGRQVYRLTVPVLTGAAATAGGIRVQWNRISGAESYLVYRKSGNSGWVRIAQVQKTDYLDQAVASGSNYTYTVRANRQGVLSDYNRNGLGATAR